MSPLPCRWHRVAALLVFIAIALAFPSGEAVAQEKEPAKPKREPAMKRLAPTTEEDLRLHLKSVPEAGFDQLAVGALYAPIVNDKSQVKNQPPDLGPKSLALLGIETGQPYLSALPLNTGRGTELSKQKAEELRTLSIKLRTALDKFSDEPGEPPSREQLRVAFADKEWTAPGALPAITQIMQAEGTEVRLLLVGLLAKSKGKEAGAALARRAVFDLSPEVREKAIRALAERPAAEYSPTLLDAFRYPWSIAAEHAAEAAVALQRQELVPDLVKLLKEPDPRLPVKTERGYAVREVVRVNHLSNCVLCHALALTMIDRVRGAGVPIPGSKIPRVPYYQGRSEVSIRPDVTYLRQDFSVVQTVANPNKWPDAQRYDYLVRTRTLSETEQTAFLKAEKDGTLPKTYPQQASVLFALRELTGQDHGTTHDDWINGLQKAPPQPAKDKPDPQKP